MTWMQMVGIALSALGCGISLFVMLRQKRRSEAANAAFDFSAVQGDFVTLTSAGYATDVVLKSMQESIELTYAQRQMLEEMASQLSAPSAFTQPPSQPMSYGSYVVSYGQQVWSTGDGEGDGDDDDGDSDGLASEAAQPVSDDVEPLEVKRGGLVRAIKLRKSDVSV